jgi:hypothetical protein
MTGITTRYGPRKLGEKQFAEQQARRSITSASGVVYGSRKGGPAPATTEPNPANPFLAAADPNGDGRVTLAELTGRLNEDGSLLDLAIEAEFKDGEPRKGALRLFRGLEEQREGGPRAEVMHLIAQFEGAQSS